MQEGASQSNQDFRQPGWLTALYAIASCVPLAFVWIAVGPDSLFFAVVMFGCSFGSSAIFIPFGHSLPSGCYEVPRSERRLHRALGVPIFATLLELSGWNRFVIEPARKLRVDRASMHQLRISVRGAMGLHALCFAAHLPLALLALVTGHFTAVLWIMVPGVILHLYPVLLQRAMLLRLEPLLHRVRR